VNVSNTSRTRRNRRSLFPEFDQLEEMFDEAFKLLDVFQSTARMRMLLMMSRGPVDTASMRRTINPKLVYENITLMREKRLIEEVEEGGFNLTETGRRILEEYIEFLESLQKSIWET
jgi:predicted transcriptional regulator